ncbi:MAG: carbohydrate binding domain-containing protein [Candidatus Omnitrophota bacterium]
MTRCDRNSILCLCILSGIAVSLNAGELTPFLLPWDDAGDGVTNVSALLDKPAGKSGFIHIENGHFIDGAGRRFRILGVNMAFSGNFPTHEQSEKVAARMAKYGINGIRHHHMDTLRAPNGVWKEGTPEKQALDAENLDRFDYFIYQLKRHGIYSNINLKVGRKTVAADGLPQADKLPGYDKGVDHYFPRLIELQKNYARDLLTHRNPYTGTRYIEEPCIAMIEINNESGLASKWSGGDLDDLPAEYVVPLQLDWNRFLQKKYANTGAVQTAWRAAASGSGQEQLKEGANHWVFQQIEEGKGTRQIVPEGPDGAEALKLTTTAVGKESWHVQTFYPGLSLKGGGFYSFSAWMKSDRSRDVSVGVKMNHSPWEGLDEAKNIQVGSEWKKVELSFSPNRDEPDARLDIGDLGDELGILWVAQFSLIDGTPIGLPAGESLENASINVLPRSRFGERSAAAKRDWIEFLVQRETQYYQDMNQYLRGELGVKSIIAGTQLGFGAVASQLANDFIDHHAYWRHPVFPNKPWDAVDWYVRNDSILNEMSNPLEQLMQARVEGRAYTVSEYNHPAPNTYASECIPLTMAYAAFQDWDGVFFFAYSHNNNFSKKSMNSFFDIAGNTPKMLAMPAAANMFLRGDISPAKQRAVGAMSYREYLGNLTEHNGSTWYRPFSDAGIKSTAPYWMRTEMRFEENPQPVENPKVPPTTRIMTSDTDELTWDNSMKGKSFAAIRAEKTKGFVGFVSGRHFDLGHGVKLEIGETIQDWANILLTYMGEKNKERSWLLTATGYAENQGMKWKDGGKESVGNQWGEGPPMVEAIPLQLTFSRTDPPLKEAPLVSAKLFSLDERGVRKEVIPQAIQFSDEAVVVDLMRNQPSLWYELVFPSASVGDGGQY